MGGNDNEKTKQSLVAFRQRHENAGGILFFFALVDFDFGLFGGFFGFGRFGTSGQAARYAENRGKNERNERKIADHCFRQAFQRVLQDVGKRAVSKVEEIDGQHYTEVESYSERIRVLNKLGATDLDIIQTNMLGNTEFSEILKTPRAQKTMTSQEICEYVMTKKGVVTIKKRGAINWTFKYGMKSFLMIREGKDGTYKVSIKCFPDMAVRLNEVFKALEDSNFPAGPIWFSFSELRNLPPKVIEYLIDTAYQIGVMQQKKTDMLKDSKPLSAYDIDGNAIKNKYLAGESVMEFPKFTLVFQRGPKADMNTLLINPPKDLDTSKFIKEFYFKFAFNSELSLTMLPQKGFSDEAATVFFDNIEQVLLKASKSAQ